MRIIYRAAAVLIAIAFLAVVTRLAHYENGLPPHQDRWLPGGEPATLYLPGTSNEPGPGNPFFETFPRPVADRPPAVVLIHGFSGDRVNTSALARRIAQNVVRGGGRPARSRCLRSAIATRSAAWAMASDGRFSLPRSRSVRSWCLMGLTT